MGSGERLSVGCYKSNQHTRYMEWLKKFDTSTTQMLKFIAVGAVALFGLYIIANLLMLGSRGYGLSEDGVMSSKVASTPSYDNYAARGISADEAQLSLRNVAERMPVPRPESGYVPGADAESFEVKQYTASIETRNLAGDCAIVRGLKSRPDVIFETTSEYDRGCTYTFKVEKQSAAEVLALIEELDPKDLNESVYTIKQEVTDYTSEIDILEKKLAALDATLTEALASYENITALATRTGDVESLAKIIDSKLSLIERLTNARLETSGQLERIARAKAEALDRLAYTNFSVSIYENTFVDGEAITDSWKLAVQRFLFDVNTLIQEMSIGFVAFLLMIVKFVLYAVVLLFVLRFGFSFAKQIWNKPPTQ